MSRRGCSSVGSAPVASPMISFRSLAVPSHVLPSCSSMSTLTALACSLPNPVRQWAPETARSGGAPASGRCAAACYPSRRAVHQHVDEEGLRATQHERALTRDPTPHHEGSPIGWAIAGPMACTGKDLDAGVRLLTEALRQRLPFVDTYRTMCIAPKPTMKRLLADAREFHLVA